MNIEDLMKHYTEGGRMIRHLNGKKEYILSEEDMRALKQLVKNCSIPAVILPLPNQCCWGGNNNNFGGVCSVCGGANKGNGI